jgi:serine/threonine protein kinase
MSQVICSRCQQMNRLGAKFCHGCGAQLPSQLQPVGWANTPPLSSISSGAKTGMLPPNAIVNGRYLIIQKIGQGGMGAVYKVTDTQRGHHILALKEMSDSAITSQVEKQQMVAQFEQEARLLQNLQHHNLPYVADKFSVSDRHYLVMEFINGRTLQQMLDAGQGPFPEHLVAEWAAQLCDVLGYLHSQRPPIIFRDLKPDNIMLTASGQIKLIDFGIVRFFKPGQKKDTMALGTPGYFAPEQVSGQTSEKSDVYSLGATLFHLLTDQDPSTYPPFSLPSVRQVNPSVSVAMEQLVLCATQSNPAQRLPNMATVRSRIPGGQRASGSAKPTKLSSTGSSLLPNPSGSGPAKSARPTMRLVQATAKLTAQLTNQQLVMAGIALLTLILFSVWLITPHIQGTWFWHNVPTIAIIGPVAFAATRRAGVGGVAHAIVAFLAGSLTWYRADLSGDYMALFIAALISGGAIEAVLYFLPHVTAGMKQDDPETWKWEAGWLGLATVVGFVLLSGITFDFGIALRFFPLLSAVLIGGLGWFIGDSIFSAWTLKQTGIKWR